jgi:hypothetical protein
MTQAKTKSQVTANAERGGDGPCQQNRPHLTNELITIAGGKIVGSRRMGNDFHLRQKIPQGHKLHWKSISETMRPERIRKF